MPDHSNSADLWEQSDLISTYTRAQALADGVLVDITLWAREAGFTIPVAVTAAVWAILALAGVSVVSAATSHHVEHPTATAFYHGYVVAASLLVGLYWYLRRPGSAFGALLALFGIGYLLAQLPALFERGLIATEQREQIAAEYQAKRETIEYEEVFTGSDRTDGPQAKKFLNVMIRSG